jgi:hypothetical protein
VGEGGRDSFGAVAGDVWEYSADDEVGCGRADAVGVLLHAFGAGPLEKTADFLKASGYRFVGLNENAPRYFVLNVERVETHSAETLFQRNAGLYEVAERFGLDSYDGMDVGPVVAVN